MWRNEDYQAQKISKSDKKQQEAKPWDGSQDQVVVAEWLQSEGARCEQENKEDWCLMNRDIVNFMFLTFFNLFIWNIYWSDSRWYSWAMMVLLGYYHISKYPLLGDRLEHAGSLKSWTQGHWVKSRDHSLVNINVHFIAAALSQESPAKSIHHTTTQLFQIII